MLAFCPALDEEFREPPNPIRLAEDEEGAGSRGAAWVARRAAAPAAADRHARAAGDRRRRSELGRRRPLLLQLHGLLGLLPSSVGLFRGRQPATGMDAATKVR